MSSGTGFGCALCGNSHTIGNNNLIGCFSASGTGNEEISGIINQTSDPEVVVDYVEKDPTGRYVRYSDILGRGAFKTVYKAFDQLDGIEVAWSRIKIDAVLRSPQDLEKLDSEVYLLKQLKHENVLKFYDSWFDLKKRTINMITELFTSGSLRQFRGKHKSVDLKAVKNWATQILRGLDYLHSQNPPVIHRDLKCDNIFVNGNYGEVKIGDFGLATAMQEPTAKSVTGTPEFMAPELYEEEYNELIDIYSFGMCMLEMVTLDYPYSECKNPAQIYKKVISGVKPASLCKVNDPEVKRFIEQCLVPASDRLPAKELLKDPFLLPECVVVKEESSKDRPSSSSNCRSQAMDIDHPEDDRSVCTDSNPEKQGYPSFEFEVVYHNKLFQSRGRMNQDGNSIEFDFRIIDMFAGPVIKIHFQFFLGSDDTGLSLAADMVRELCLEDHYVSFIADLIDFLIKRILSLTNEYSAAGDRNFLCEGRHDAVELRTTTTTSSTIDSSPNDLKQQDHHHHHHHSSKLQLDHSLEMMGADMGFHFHPFRTSSESEGSTTTDKNGLNCGMSNEEEEEEGSRKVVGLDDEYSKKKAEFDEIEIQFQKLMKELNMRKQEAIEAAKKKWKEVNNGSMEAD